METYGVLSPKGSPTTHIRVLWIESARNLDQQVLGILSFSVNNAIRLGFVASKVGESGMWLCNCHKEYPISIFHRMGRGVCLDE